MFKFRKEEKIYNTYIYKLSPFKYIGMMRCKYYTEKTCVGGTLIASLVVFICLPNYLQSGLLGPLSIFLSLTSFLCIIIAVDYYRIYKGVKEEFKYFTIPKWYHFKDFIRITKKLYQRKRKAYLQTQYKEDILESFIMFADNAIVQKRSGNVLSFIFVGSICLTVMNAVFDFMYKVFLNEIDYDKLNYDSIRLHLILIAFLILFYIIIKCIIYGMKKDLEISDKKTFGQIIDFLEKRQ